MQREPKFKARIPASVSSRQASCTLTAGALGPLRDASGASGQVLGITIIFVVIIIPIRIQLESLTCLPDQCPLVELKPLPFALQTPKAGTPSVSLLLHPPSQG